MFTVIIPAWEGHPCWMNLEGSRYTQHRILLAAADHGFFEGAQHNRANRYRAASTATSVLFLQNESARVRWPVTTETVEKMTKAFRPKNTTVTGAKLQPSFRARLSGDAFGGICRGGADALMGGAFAAAADKEARSHAPCSLPSAPHTPTTPQKERCDMLWMGSCKHAGRGAAPGSDPSSLRDAKGQHEGVGHHGGQEADASSAGGAKKRRRYAGRVAASTGKFASESSALAVLQRVLQSARVGDGEGGDVDREEGLDVVFPLSKSQKHKQDGKASRRRKMVGKMRCRR
jgi:hypothetical protein